MTLRVMLAALLSMNCMAVPMAAAKQAAQDNRSVQIPSEGLFKLELLSRISTDTNKKGDKFSCRVIEPAEFSNAIVSGEIVKIKASRKVGGSSEISLSFGKIALPDGRITKFGAQAVEIENANAGDGGKADDEGNVKGKSTRKQDALKIAAGGIIGAVIGGLLGGRAGAVLGATIGTAFGTTTVLSTNGPSLDLKQGSRIIVRTDKRKNRQ